LKVRNTLGAGAIALITLGLSSAYAGTVYDYTFDGSNSHGSYTATVSLFSESGQAISGGGSITGGGLTHTESLKLVTLASPGVENDGGGLLGYRSNDGTDWYDADTTVPIDTNGLIFAIGPGPVGYETSQQFDIWNNGNNTYSAGFFGAPKAGITPGYWEYNEPVNVSLTTKSDVPEPATWAELLFGMFAIAFMVHGKRRKEAHSAI